MDPQKNDLVFLAIIGIATYIYVMRKFIKKPDTTQYGISLGAMMTALISFGAVLFGFIMIEMAGFLGYIIIVIFYPFFIQKITQKITSD